MTIIIALKDEKNNRVIMGADKQTTCGQLIQKSPSKLINLPLNIIDEYGKIIEESEIHIGLCGYAFMKEFFKHGFEIPVMNEKDKFVKYLYQDFLPSLRRALTDNLLVKLKDNSIDTKSGMLFVFKGEIYEIASNLSVTEIDNEFHVDGSGYEVATGSLYTNLKYHEDLDKKEIVKQAIETAGENTIYCDTNVEIIEIKY